MLTSAVLHPRFRRLALVLAAWALATPAAAGTTAVYKCFDRNLNVLYTDQPCAGELLEIRAGDPDAAALAALQKERDALAKSIEQRIADSRKPPREIAVTEPVVPLPANAYTANDVWYPGYAAYPPRPPPRRNRDDAARDDRRERAGYVPNPLPPRSLPRR